MTAKILTTSV